MEQCLAIVVDLNNSLIEDLKKFGYDKRSGSPSYNRDQMVIVPKKKWYWLTKNEILGTKNICI